MEIYPQAGELKVINLYLSHDIVKRDMTLSQGHDTSIIYKEHLCKVWWKSIHLSRQLNNKVEGKNDLSYLVTLK